MTSENEIRIFWIPYGFLLVWGDWTGAMVAGGAPHEGTNSQALTFKLDTWALRSSSPWSQLSGAPPDDILESNKMLKNQKKNSNLICVFQLNAAWTTSYTRWKAKMRCYQIRKRQIHVVLSPKKIRKRQELHENVR